MVLNSSGLKQSPRFGAMLYGIPFLCLLILQLMPSGHSQLNPVQKVLVIITPLTLLVLSTVLGAIVDNYFRSNPRAPVTKVLFIGSFAWAFLFVAIMLSVAYLAFKTYDANHHTNFMPQDVFSSWAASIGKLLMGTILGGIFFLPLNGLFVFLVRRRYNIRVSNSSHLE